MELFLHQNGEQVGPYTEEQLATMVASGGISCDDIVWHEGLAGWLPIKSVIRLPSTTAPNPPQNTNTQKPSDNQKTAKGFVVSRKVLIAAPAILGLFLGYFVGREHVKYQIRSAFTNAGSAFSEGLNIDRSKKRESSPISIFNSQTESVPDPEPTPQFALGESYTGDDFSIKLVSAKIAPSKVKSMMGDIRTGKTPDLAFSFVFTNTDDRKILRFREGNQFMRGHFNLRDDVDNVIRGIDYGLATTPVGALSGSEDISPGSASNHIELFTIPPPKTEYLILTVDLACLGGDGEIEFKIPASAIAK